MEYVFSKPEKLIFIDFMILVNNCSLFIHRLHQFMYLPQNMSVVLINLVSATSVVVQAFPLEVCIFRFLKTLSSQR